MLWEAVCEALTGGLTSPLPRAERDAEFWNRRDAEDTEKNVCFTFLCVLCGEPLLQSPAPGCVETLLRVIHRRLYRAGAGSGLIYLTPTTRGKGTELQRVAVVRVCARNIALRSSFALLADLCGDNLYATIPNRATRR